MTWRVWNPVPVLPLYLTRNSKIASILDFRRGSSPLSFARRSKIMQTKNALVLLLLVAAAFGGWFFYQDFQFRKEHGIVTDVTYLNWEQEVELSRDAQPVLVYFYDGTKDNHNRQNPVVESFAWDNAGSLKVVRCDVSRPENRLIAIAHGAFREPAFVLLDGDKLVLGAAGVVVNQDQLENLLR